jgi:hypothetical protein
MTADEPAHDGIAGQMTVSEGELGGEIERGHRSRTIACFDSRETSV